MRHRCLSADPHPCLSSPESDIICPQLSVGGALRQRAAKRLDAECQLVEAETEPNENACFRGIQGVLIG